MNYFNRTLATGLGSLGEGEDKDIPDKDNGERKLTRNKTGSDEELRDSGRTLNEIGEDEDPLAGAKPTGSNPTDGTAGFGRRSLGGPEDESRLPDLHNESVTGTGAIAAPAGFVRPKKKKSKPEDEKVRNLQEYTASGGKASMPSPTGNGVVEKSVGTKYPGDKAASDTTDMGKEWPRKQKNTGGSWESGDESKCVEPNDEKQSEHSGDMAANLGQNKKQKNKGGQWETAGGEGKMSEGYDVDDIAACLEEDFDHQYLFNSYAGSPEEYICLETFQELCDSYGVGIISEEFFYNLMATNPNYVFTPTEDKDWFRKNVLDDKDGDDDGKKSKKDDKDSDGDELVDEGDDFDEEPDCALGDGSEDGVSWGKSADDNPMENRRPFKQLVEEARSEPNRILDEELDLAEMGPIGVSASDAGGAADPLENQQATVTPDKRGPVSKLMDDVKDDGTQTVDDETMDEGMGMGAIGAGGLGGEEMEADDEMMDEYDDSPMNDLGGLGDDDDIALGPADDEMMDEMEDVPTGSGARPGRFGDWGDSAPRGPGGSARLKQTAEEEARHQERMAQRMGDEEMVDEYDDSPMNDLGGLGDDDDIALGPADDEMMDEFEEPGMPEIEPGMDDDMPEVNPRQINPRQMNSRQHSDNIQRAREAFGKYGGRGRGGRPSTDDEMVDEIADARPEPDRDFSNQRDMGVGSSQSRGAPPRGLEHDPYADETDEVGADEFNPFESVNNMGMITEGDLRSVFTSSTDDSDLKWLRLLAETHEDGMAADASATEDGTMTGDATEPLEEIDPNAETSISPTEGESHTHGKATDGITKDMGMGSKLGENDKQKNKGGQHEPLAKSGVGKMADANSKMYENILRLTRSAKRSIAEAVKDLKKGSYAVSFRVVAEGVESHETTNVAEAMADAEELIQTTGGEDVTVEASISDSAGTIILTKQVPLITISPRSPVTNEGAILFRYKKVANIVAEDWANRGVTCRVQSHKWGAAIRGKNITPRMIKAAFGG